MAAQEKNQKKRLSSEPIMKAIQRMKEKKAHTDLDGLEIFDGEIARQLDIIMKHRENSEN